MEGRKDNRFIASLILGMIAGLVCWVALLALRATGSINLHWAIVTSSLLWFSWLMWGVFWLMLTIRAKLTHWYHRCKRDARIIRQAKAMGVWNTKAGGRALELYGREQGVKRYPGETDANLRARIKEKAERKWR